MAGDGWLRVVSVHRWPFLVGANDAVEAVEAGGQFAVSALNFLESSLAVEEPMDAFLFSFKS